jgi:hypothetical protein
VYWPTDAITSALALFAFGRAYVNSETSFTNLQ